MRNLYRYLFLSLILSLTPATAIADERYPLEPPDTSSPRATMESFQGVMRDTKTVLMKSREWGVFSREARQEIKRLRNRFMHCLDLSKVPERLVDHMGPDAVALLAEILDRIELPPRVFFDEFNRNSLDIMMVYWYHPPDWRNFQAFNQSVNMQIMQEFKKQEIKLAFPTTTTYLTQDREDPLHVRFFGDSQLTGKTR